MILSIDLGSTSFKAAVFDERLRQVSVGGRRIAHRYAPGGRVELDVAAVETALRGAIKAAGVGEHKLSAIALTSQAQTFTFVDDDGRARMPFISWQDTRTAKLGAVLQKPLPDFAAHCSFNEPIAGLQIGQLRLLKGKHTGMPLLLPSYVVRLWTGATVTDNNIAAMSGLYSLVGQRWWRDALRVCGLRADRLPQVIRVGRVAAETTRAARRFGLPAGVPVVLAGNDQTAGAYGARLERTGALLLTLGTAQVAYRCAKRMPRPGTGLIRGPYPGGRYYGMAADNCGGNIVTWAKTVLAGGDDVSDFFREAARSPRGAHGLEFDASLDVERGGWGQLGLHHTRADLARAVLESLSRRMAKLVDAVGGVAKGETALAAGGGSEQPVWRQCVAEALGVRLKMTEARPLLGAARMAAEAV
jgi:sugar (pentulose or hexulose) kinase